MQTEEDFETTTPSKRFGDENTPLAHPGNSPAPPTSDQTPSSMPASGQPNREEPLHGELERRLAAQEDPLLRPKKLSWGWRSFVAITVAVAAGAGGAIGAAVGRLGCEGCSALSLVLGAAMGATFAGIGMTVLAILVARSFVEWESSRRKRSRE